MASKQTVTKVAAARAAAMMPPASDLDDADLEQQLKRLEQEVALRHSEVDARFDALEPRTERIEEASTMLGKFLEKHGDSLKDARDRLTQAETSLETLSVKAHALDTELGELDDQMIVQTDATALLEKRQSASERVNEAMQSAVASMEKIDQAHSDELGALNGRLNVLEPAQQALREAHDELSDHTAQINSRTQALEHRSEQLAQGLAGVKTSHASLATHVSELDIRSAGTSDDLQRSKWVGGALGLVIALVAIVAVWQGVDNHRLFDTGIAAQSEALQDTSASLEKRIVANQAATSRLAADTDQSRQAVAVLGGEVAGIQARIHASDEAMQGAPVDMTSLNGLNWLQAQPADDYVIQIAASYSLRSLSNLLARHRDTLDLANVSWFKTTHNGRDWFVLLYGNYTGFAGAMQAMDALPQALQKSGPYVRGISGVLHSAERS